MFRYVSGAVPRLSLLALLALPAAAQAQSEVDAAKEQMRTLSTATTAGEYFPETMVPVDMDAFRKAVLTIGNAARRDPNYRRDHGKKAAIDLSGDTTATIEGIEKVYKNNPAPPYFNDIVFYKELNQTCQFWAEYQAKIQKGGHVAPGLTYKGADMSNIGARFKFFSGFEAQLAEGGGAPIEADGYPESWLLTETHYRPWFNVGGETVAMGFGIAQNKTDGKWYGCKLAILNDQAVTAKLTPEQTPNDAPAAAAPAAEPPKAAGETGPALNWIGGPFEFQRGVKYPSVSGTHYVVFQNDGNLVVYTKDDQFVWGLNTVITTFPQNARVVFQADGILATYDANGGLIWSALSSEPRGGATLVLQDSGHLQIVNVFGDPHWSSH